MNNTNQIPTVTVNGQEVPNFVPANDVQAAIVPLVVLQKLASLLPSISISEIKLNMRTRIAAVTTLEEYVALLDDELNFHKTINLITMYQPEEIATVPAKEEYVHSH